MRIMGHIVEVIGNSRIFEKIYRQIKESSYRERNTFGWELCITPPGYIQVPEELVKTPNENEIGKVSMRISLPGYPLREVIQVDPTTVKIYPYGNGENAERISTKLRELYGELLQIKTKKEEMELPDPVQEQKDVPVLSDRSDVITSDNFFLF
jgi:hypothetical protein